MGEKFADTEMDADTFQTAFAEELANNYHRFWTLIGPTKRGLIPVGFVLGFWSHPEPRFAPFMIVGDMLWMPWATQRNRIESAAHFFAHIRSQIPMVEYAREPDRKFFDVMCRLGVMQRVGTMFNVYPGEKCAVFETRMRENDGTR